MIDHNPAIASIKNTIIDKKDRIESLKYDDSMTSFVEKEIKSLEKYIDNLEGSIATLTTFTNEPSKIINNHKRLKIFKGKEEIEVSIIEKNGKQYVIVPLEVLPEKISF